MNTMRVITKEYKEKLIQRLEIWQKCDRDPVFRVETLKRCAEDSVFWCDNFAFTFDPRQDFFKSRNLPFILFDKQVEMVRWVEGLLKEREDGIIEKSRDMGVSYTILIPVVLYQWLFKEFNARIGSRKEETVDRTDDPDTLFWKIDYNLRRLPNWMLPPGFDWNKHRTYMRLSRPDNQNTIVGESSNEAFGRSGRSNLVLLDEFGFFPYAKSAWESCGESTTTRLAISTPPPSGKSSFFYKLAQSGRLKRFSIHYTDDPRKDAAWIEKQKAKKSADEFERELDISYQGSSEDTVYSAQFNLCEFGKFLYNPTLPLFISWDFGLDATPIQWYQWDYEKDHWFLIDSYTNSNLDVGFYAPFVKGLIESGYEYSESEMAKIREHRYWKNATHFGDPDVKKRAYQVKGATSTRDRLEKYGIYVQSKSWAGKTHYDMKQKTMQFLKKLSIDEKKNEFFCDAIRSARYPERSEISQSTQAVMNPIHDWTCMSGETRVKTVQFGEVEMSKLATNLIFSLGFWIWGFDYRKKRLKPMFAQSCEQTWDKAPLLTISLSTGKMIRCTPEHRFLLDEGIWRMASELGFRDKLKSCDGEVRIDKIKIGDEAPVFDIYVPIYHNFIAEGVVVHNSHHRTALEYMADNAPSKSEYVEDEGDLVLPDFYTPNL